MQVNIMAMFLIGCGHGLIFDLSNYVIVVITYIDLTLFLRISESFLQQKIQTSSKLF